jgi:DNA-binding response OmpR family regulator/Tfp pilus assembly protein PilF
MELTLLSTSGKPVAQNGPVVELRKVLVVDDQPSVRKIVKKMLYDLKSFKVIDEADDGEEAWTKIRKRRTDQYHIVVTDIWMPKLDGMGLICRCRKSSFAKNMQFLTITGETKPEILAFLGEVGVRDCLVKPFSFQLFQDRIVELLRRLKNPTEQSYTEIASLIQSGDYEEALARVEGLGKDESEKPRWLNLKGEILLGMGRLDLAKACIEQALQSCDSYLTALCNKAALEEKSGNLDAAIESLEKADSISPLMVDRKINLSDLLFQANRDEEGRAKLCMAASATQDYETKLRVAEMLHNKGYEKDSDKIMNRLLLLKSSNIETYNRIGISLRKLGKYRDAEITYMSALNYHPENAAIYCNIGILYLYKMDKTKACEYFKKALSYNPALGKARDLLDYYDGVKAGGMRPAVRPNAKETEDV